MNENQNRQLRQLFGGAVVPVAKLGKPLELTVAGETVASATTTEAAIRQASRVLSAAARLTTTDPRG